MSYIGNTPTFNNVKESAPLDIAISALNIDWSLGDTFYKTISSASTFTFSNDVNGKSIVVAITNSSASDRAVTWPGGVLADLNYDGTVVAGTTSLFTFVKIAGTVYVAEMKEIA